MSSDLNTNLSLGKYQGISVESSQNIDIAPKYPRILSPLLKSNEFSGLSNDLISFYYEPGLRRAVSFVSDNPNHNRNCESIDMYSRNAMIYEIFSSYKSIEEFEENVSIYMLDLKFFREISAVIDKNGKSFGDITLNDFARCVDTNLDKINKSLVQKGQQGLIRISRYGGDEFCIIFDKVPKDFESGYLEEIKKSVEEIDTLYNFGEELGIYEGKLSIKEIKKVEVPNQEKAKNEFWRSLRNGLIATESIKGDIKLSIEISQYLESLNNNKKSLNDILNLMRAKGQDFSNIADKIATIDFDKLENLTEAQLEQYLEFMLFDNLLGDIVYPMRDFAIQLMDKYVHALVVVDIKNIKSINDLLSHFVGDLTIQGVTLNLTRKLNETRLHVGNIEIVLTRRGSTMLIGIVSHFGSEQKDVSAIDKEAAEKLISEINRHITQNGGELVQNNSTFKYIPLIHTSKVERHISTDTEAFAEISKAMNETEETWYQNMFMNIFERLDILRELESPREFKIESLEKYLNDPKNYIPDFLLRKRPLERVGALINAAKKIILQNKLLQDNKQTQILPLNRRDKYDPIWVLDRMRFIYAKINQAHKIAKLKEIEENKLIRASV